DHRFSRSYSAADIASMNEMPSVSHRRWRYFNGFSGGVAGGQQPHASVNLQLQKKEGSHWLPAVHRALRGFHFGRGSSRPKVCVNISLNYHRVAVTSRHGQLAMTIGL